jgi:hypothetical protein
MTSAVVDWLWAALASAGLGMRRLYDAVIVREGSTRAVAVLRVLVTLAFITRFSGELRWFSHPGMWWTVATLSFIGSTTLFLLGWLWPLARAWNLFTVAWMAFGVGFGARHHHWHHHHTLLLFSVMALLSLAPAAGSLSVDRWRAVRKAEREGTALPAERGPVWAQWLIALQTSAVYFWGGWDKLSVAYLSGWRLQHHTASQLTHFDTPDAWWFAIACGVAAVLSVLLEFGLAFGLFFRRLWLPLVVCGVLFHIFIFFTFNVATFSATIVILYVAYVDPDRFHEASERLLGGRTTASAPIVP